MRISLRAEREMFYAVYASDKFARTSIRLLFSICLAVITISILLEVARHFDIRPLPERLFSLSSDRSIPEFYNYLQSLTCVIFLYLSFKKYNQRAFLFLTLLFSFILVDDSLSYHESFGDALTRFFDIPAFGNLRAEDSGELLAWAFAALVLVPPLLWCLLKRKPGELGVYLVYALIFCGLAFFAVGVDLLHVLSNVGIPEGSFARNVLRRILGWVEDGGEMLVIAAAASCAILYYRAPQDVYPA